jgi:arylsulfatase A-like enzyme
MLGERKCAQDSSEHPATTHHANSQADFFVSGGGASLRTERGKKARNIVFILADDLGVVDLGCQGSDYYKTPRLDEFAKTAVRFTNAYAAHPVCSPTRGAILTGRYPARLHLTSHIPGYRRPHAKLMPLDWTPYVQGDETTYAEALRDAGFATFHVGKWHVSSKTGPAEHGFQEVAADRAQQTPKNMNDPWFVDSYTKALEEFMERNKDRPFLAVLSHGTVHVPLYEKEERIARWRDLPPGKNGQNNPVMAAMVERLDSSVGRILDKIKELGIEKETAVVFTSDNGGLTNVQDEKTGKMVTATSNLPWRSGKSQLYEGGIRVPLLIRWPGVTKPDTVCGTPVSSMDLFPTFLEMAGLPPLPDQHLDGLSLAPLFEGGGLKRNNLFWHFPHYHTLPPHGAVRSGHWKLVLNYETDTAELFDLEADPGEKKIWPGTSPAWSKPCGIIWRVTWKPWPARCPGPIPITDPRAKTREFIHRMTPAKAIRPKKNAQSPPTRKMERPCRHRSKILPQLASY